MMTLRHRQVRLITAAEKRVILSRLLPTWQTAAAIAQHSGLPARTVLALLKAKGEDWGLETRLARVDGHNEVHMFRQRQHILVMGVSFPMVADDQEEAEV